MEIKIVIDKTRKAKYVGTSPYDMKPFYNDEYKEDRRRKEKPRKENYSGRESDLNMNALVEKEKRKERVTIPGTRWRFKSCPKCKTGDMSSTYGDFFTCFQCGYINYPKGIKEEKNGKS